MVGHLISFEGPDGAGKTTVIREVVKQLADRIDQEIMVTREPGGSVISEKIRDIILNPEYKSMDDWTEALLFTASRRQHLVEVIIPALQDDRLVICDRYLDSSIAYQGGGDQLGIEKVAQLNNSILDGYYPELTFYLDVPSEVGLKRIKKNNNSFDRLESKKLEFHHRVRNAYLKLLDDNPERMVKIDATREVRTSANEITNIILSRIN